MDTGYKVVATVKMTREAYDGADNQTKAEVLVLNYPDMPIEEAFDAVHSELQKLTGIREQLPFSVKNKTLETVLLLDPFMSLVTEKTREAWRQGRINLYSVKITLQFTRVEEKRISNKEFGKLKEKAMWDLETLKRLNGEEPEVQEDNTKATEEETQGVSMQYNITGELNVYILEDHENEIGVFERSKSFDVGEPMFYSSKGNSDSLEATIGKFRNECYVEPEKWVVRMITADFTIGSRKVIEITANDYFDSEGYTLAYTPEELKQEVFTDDLYFTEQQYKAYVFREGWVIALRMI